MRLIPVSILRDKEEAPPSIATRFMLQIQMERSRASFLLEFWVIFTLGFFPRDGLLHAGPEHGSP